LSNNTEIIVDLSKYETDSNITLMKSNDNCLSKDQSIKIQNINSDCEIVNEVWQSDALSLFVTKDPTCDENNPKVLELWEITLIIVGSVVGVVLIFLVIVFSIPSLRNIILPNKKKKKYEK